MSEQYVQCPGLCGMKVVYRGNPNAVNFCCLNCWDRVAQDLGLRGDGQPLNEDHPPHSSECDERQKYRRNAPTLNIAVGFRLNLGVQDADNDQTPPASPL